MAYVPIDTAIATENFIISGNIVVKTIRSGFSGIYNQSTFSVTTEGSTTKIIEDGLNDAPVVLITATKVTAVSNTRINPFVPAAITEITVGEDEDATKVALAAFKKFALDDFTFPQYNVLVDEILVDGAAD